MEEEARQILQAALVAAETEPPSLVDSIRSRFAKLGDVRLPIAAREPVHRFELPNDLRQSVETATRKPVVQKVKRGT